MKKSSIQKHELPLLEKHFKKHEKIGRDLLTLLSKKSEFYGTPKFMVRYAYQIAKNEKLKEKEHTHLFVIGMMAEISSYVKNIDKMMGKVEKLLYLNKMNKKEIKDIMVDFQQYNKAPSKKESKYVTILRDAYKLGTIHKISIKSGILPYDYDSIYQQHKYQKKSVTTYKFFVNILSPFMKQLKRPSSSHVMEMMFE